MTNSSPAEDPQCPCCGEPVHRIHRRVIDRILSLFRPIRRYRCGNILCRWEGNLRREHRSRY